MLTAFYRKEFYTVLDALISELSDVKSNVETILKPLFDVLTFNQELNRQKVTKLVEFFPKNYRPDEDMLLAELEHLRTLTEKCDDARTFSFYAEKARENRTSLPHCYKAYCLALTVPVTVAKNEQTFSKLRLIKNHMRSRIGEERLEHCMLMACEKETLDNLNMDKILKQWNLKPRRIRL